MKKAKQVPIPKPKAMSANFSASGRGLFTQVKPPGVKKPKANTRMYAKNIPGGDPSSFGGAGFGNTGRTGES